MPKYTALSPDGFPIDFETYNTKKEVKQAIKKFSEGYINQGYYSTIKNGEQLLIPIDRIPDYCQIVVTPNKYV